MPGTLLETEKKNNERRYRHRILSSRFLKLISGYIDEIIYLYICSVHKRSGVSGIWLFGFISWLYNHVTHKTSNLNALCLSFLICNLENSYHQ